MSAVVLVSWSFGFGVDPMPTVCMYVYFVAVCGWQTIYFAVFCQFHCDCSVLTWNQFCCKVPVCCIGSHCAVNLGSLSHLVHSDQWTEYLMFKRYTVPISTLVCANIFIVIFAVCVAYVTHQIIWLLVVERLRRRTLVLFRINWVEFLSWSWDLNCHCQQLQQLHFERSRMMMRVV